MRPTKQRDRTPQERAEIKRVCRSIKKNAHNPKEPTPRAWKFYRLVRLKGKKLRAVADRYGISVPCVHEHVMKVQNYLRSGKGAPPDIATLRTQQLSILEHGAREALRAWERSKRPTKKTKTKTKGFDPEYGTSLENELEQAIEHGHGDPAYLNTLRGFLADIRDMYNVNVPAPKAEAPPTTINVGPGVTIMLPHNGREPLHISEANGMETVHPAVIDAETHKPEHRNGKK